MLLTIDGYEAAGRPAVHPIGLDDLRVLEDRVPPGHVVSQGSFCYGARCLRIEVDFGAAPSSALRDGVDRVLASLSVAHCVHQPGQSLPSSRQTPETASEAALFRASSRSAAGASAAIRTENR